MLRDCDLEEISDGKRYNVNDMVKADCGGCEGCSACCHGMGHSIVLDPLDIHQLMSRLEKKFEALLEYCIELNIVDGVILPNLKMRTDKAGEPCFFLDEQGRCSIHEERPGICRIFPLGRIYEGNSFSYILQVHECKKEERSKVKVGRWIDTPELKKNQKFIADWHFFLKSVQAKLMESGDETLIKRVTMQILQYFYIEPYSGERNFYEQFDQRLAQAKKLFEVE